MDYYVIAQFRGHQIHVFGISRFNRIVIDRSLVFLIFAEIAKEKGYIARPEEGEKYIELVKQFLRDDALSRRTIGEYLRNTGVPVEQLWERYWQIGVAMDLANRMLLDNGYVPNPDGSGLSLQYYKVFYNDYWDEVIYNPQFPLIGERFK